MFKYLLIVLSFSVLTGSAQAAETVANPAFEALAQKLKQHPEIAAYASRVEAAESYADGEMGLPDPMVFIEQKDYWFGGNTRPNNGDTMLGFRQEIPRLQLREARTAKGRVESRKTQLLEQYAFEVLQAKLITALANLQKTNQLTDLALEQQKLLRTQKDSLKGGISSDRASIGMVSIADAELQEISIRLAEIEEERHGIHAQLTNLLGATTSVEPPAIHMRPWEQDAAATYPVMVAAADIDMAAQNVEMRKAEYGPNFEVRAAGGRMSSDEAGGALMLGVSVPLWASANQKPKLRGAKASLAATKWDLEATERNVVQTLEHLRAQIHTSAQKITLYTAKTKLMEDAAQSTTREYEAGKSDLSRILDIRKDVLSIRAQTAMEQARHTALIADFNRYVAQGDEQ